MIRCTAMTRHHENPNRCVREIGHPGLHRVVVEKKINEFGDANANFPKTGFSKEELKAIAEGGS